MKVFIVAIAIIATAYCYPLDFYEGCESPIQFWDDVKDDDKTALRKAQLDACCEISKSDRYKPECGNSCKMIFKLDGKWDIIFGKDSNKYQAKGMTCARALRKCEDKSKELCRKTTTVEPMTTTKKLMTSTEEKNGGKEKDFVHSPGRKEGAEEKWNLEQRGEEKEDKNEEYDDVEYQNDFVPRIDNATGEIEMFEEFEPDINKDLFGDEENDSIVKSNEKGLELHRRTGSNWDLYELSTRFVKQDHPSWKIPYNGDEVCIYLFDLTVEKKLKYGIGAVTKNYQMRNHQEGKSSEMSNVLKHCGWIDEDGSPEVDFEEDEIPRQCSCGTQQYSIKTHTISEEDSKLECNKTEISTNNLWVKGQKFTLDFSAINVYKCYSVSCTIEITGKKNGLILTFSTEVGFAHIAFGDTYKDIEFVKVMTYEIKFEKAGIMNVHGHCNNNHFRRKVILTTQEFCDSEFPGYMWYFNNIFCKNDKNVIRGMWTAAIVTLIWLTSEISSHIIAFVISLIIVSTTFYCFKRFYCDNCCEYKLRQDHKCSPMRCPYCCSKFEYRNKHHMESDDDYERNCKNIRDRHMRECKYAKKENTFLARFRITYWFFFYLLHVILKNMHRLTLSVLLILFMVYFLSGTHAKETEDNVFAKIVAKELIEKYNLTETIKNVLDSKLKNMDNNNKSQNEITHRLKNLWCSKSTFEIFNYTTISITLLLMVSFVMSYLIAVIYRKIRRLIFGYEVVCEQCFEIGDPDKHGSFKCGSVHCPLCNVTLGLPPLMKLENASQIFQDSHMNYHGVSNRVEVWNRSKSIAIKSGITNAVKNILFIMIIYNVIYFVQCNKLHSEEMKKVEDDLETFIKDLKNSGFHPFHARFTGGARQHLSAVNEKKDCSNGQCRLRMELESDMYVAEGKEYGYAVKSTSLGKTVNINMKIRDPYVICQYSNSYKTGKILHKGVTDDTCTSSCEQCQKSLDTKHPMKIKSTVHRLNHPDSSTWACDGPGCMSMGSGCTCLRCWCEITGEIWQVKELKSEKPVFDICVSVGSTGYCKTIDKKEERNKIITILDFQGIDNRCPKTIACDKNKCMEGLINSVDENYERFGSVKIIGDESNFQIVSKKEIRAQEICHFASSRYYYMEQCCKDTYHMIHDLKTVNFVNARKDNIKDSFKLPQHNLGAWKIRIRLPNLVYQEKIDKIKMTNLRIAQCKGCHSCEEGGSCLIEVNSNLEHLSEFKCKECITDTDHILIKKGANSIPFNVYCRTKSGNLTCEINKIEAKGSYSLKEMPHVPHGDGQINVDVTKSVKDKCDGFFCDLGWARLDFFGGLKICALIIAGLLLLVLVIWMITKLRSLF